MNENCSTCKHSSGEGTIRFCDAKCGAAFDSTATCILYEPVLSMRSIESDEEDTRE